LRIEGYHRSWEVKNAKDLRKVLAWRDHRGGAMFWLAHDDKKYPCLAIRVTGESADVHFFPEDRHPGFRCLGGEGLPEDGLTTFVYEGCDPATGEQTPNHFVVPFRTAVDIATEFLKTERRSEAMSWFAL